MNWVQHNLNQRLFLTILIFLFSINISFAQQNVMVVPTAPGTPPDILSRYFVDRLSKFQNKLWIVETHLGASGEISAKVLLNKNKL